MGKPAFGSTTTAATASGLRSRMADLVLVRIATGGGRDREIARDLLPFAAPRTPAAAWRGGIAQCLAGLVIRGYTVAEHGIHRATPAGRQAAAHFLGTAEPDLASWPDTRDGALVLRALGLHAAQPARRRAVLRLDGLRGVIVETTWGIDNAGRPSAPRIRAKLASLALERAFGNQVTQALTGRTALSSKASRLLACQLSRAPRQHATDARLIAQLAAEAVGAGRSDLAHLRQGVLRKFIAEQPTEEESVPRMISLSRRLADASSPSPPTPPPARSRAPSPRAGTRVRLVEPAAPAQLPAGPVERRPDPRTFAQAVQTAAKLKAEGWPGNRKAFVSRVWAVVQERHPGWQLSEIEFKGMLAEVHRMGLLGLANADLKDRRTLAEVEASAVSYKNTVWHYVRVED